MTPPLLNHGDHASFHWSMHTYIRTWGESWGPLWYSMSHSLIIEVKKSENATLETLHWDWNCTSAHESKESKNRTRTGTFFILQAFKRAWIFLGHIIDRILFVRGLSSSNLNSGRFQCPEACGQKLIKAVNCVAFKSQRPALLAAVTRYICRRFFSQAFKSYGSAKEITPRKNTKSIYLPSEKNRLLSA